MRGASRPSISRPHDEVLAPSLEFVRANPPSLSSPPLNPLNQPLKLLKGSTKGGVARGTRGAATRGGRPRREEAQIFLHPPNEKLPPPYYLVVKVEIGGLIIGVKFGCITISHYYLGASEMPSQYFFFHGKKPRTPPWAALDAGGPLPPERQLLAAAPVGAGGVHGGRDPVLAQRHDDGHLLVQDGRRQGSTGGLGRWREGGGQGQSSPVFSLQ